MRIACLLRNWIVGFVLKSALVCGVIGSENTPEWTEQWFEQDLDHFNPQNTGVFKQRCLIDDSQFKVMSDNSSSNVIFFYAGNEGNIQGFWNNSGLIFDWAPEFHALVVFCEHRYYGESLPYLNDATIRMNTAEYFEYLTIEQALADYAVLLTQVMDEYHLKKSSTIIHAFGGSYGGVLSALMRVHYPSLVDSALAASAPWRLLLAEGDPFGVFKVITDDFHESDPRCVNVIRQAYSQIMDVFNQATENSDNLSVIAEQFGLCDPNSALITDDQREQFLLWTRNAFLDLAQSNYPYSLSGFPPWRVDNVCQNVIIPNHDSPLKSLSMSMDFVYNASGSVSCMNISQLYPHCSDHCWCGMGSDAQAWSYQQCTQVSIPVATNNITDMFPQSTWSMSQMTEYCLSRFNTDPSMELPRMQQWYPLDLSSQVTSKIIFSVGTLDPWSVGSFHTSLGPELPVITVEKGAHHYDLRGNHINDTLFVKQVRQLEKSYFLKWSGLELE